MLGWGSTYGVNVAAVQRVRARGIKVAQAHLMHLNPFPSNLGEVLGRYRRVLIPENNLGQLAMLVRAHFLVDAVTLSKVQGTPFRIAEVERAIVDLLGGWPKGQRRSRAVTDVETPTTSRKDWATDQEVRWCPGCGDYSILAAMQFLLPELGVKRETRSSSRGSASRRASRTT